MAAVADQWRVLVVFDDRWGRNERWRCRRDLAQAMRDHTGVVVVGAPTSGLNALVRTLSRADESPVCAYTGSRAVAQTAAQVAREVTGQHGMGARVSVECRRPVTRQWEDASSVSEHDLAEERDYQQREDRRLSAETGVPQWRVRVELPTHHDAVTLGQRLSSEGIEVAQRWKSVIAGADSEDGARRLAEKIQEGAPPDAEIFPERAGTSDWQAPFVPTWCCRPSAAE